MFAKTRLMLNPVKKNSLLRYTVQDWKEGGCENEVELLILWLWCMFYGCRGVDDLASLGLLIWTGPAVEGGRMTADESLTALPRPVYLHPPDGATRTEAGLLSHLCTGPHWGSSNSSAAPYSRSPSGAKQPRGRNWGNTSNLLRCPPTHTFAYLYKCTVPDNLTPHPLQFLLCCFNLSQLSGFSRFYFLFSVPLSLPLHSPGSQLGLNTHRRVLRTNINFWAWEDRVGSLFKCVIWDAWEHMLKILLKALVLHLVIASLRLALAVMISVSPVWTYYFIN